MKKTDINRKSWVIDDCETYCNKVENDVPI